MDNGYIIGATVFLVVEVFQPNTTIPTTATSVTLDGLYCGTTLVPVSPNDFTNTGGTWTFTLATTGYAPGVYTWRAKAITATGVGLSEDTFVLRNPFS